MLPQVMKDRAPKEGEEEARTYERPTLTVVGNLKDLLAGSGSLGNDDTLCNQNNGLDPNC